MKHFTIGKIFCRCSARMGLGKIIRIYEKTANRKRCPNCDKLRMVMVKIKNKLIPMLE